jgi:Flp pilus assembly protein TadG
MTQRLKFIKAALRDQTGVAAIEMAFVLPPFMLMFLGAFDVGYSIYYRAILDGAIQEAARISALETGPVKLANIDASVTKKLRDLSVTSVVAFNRKSYFSFNDVKRAEKFSDGNANGVCDNNEQFEDENNNSGWDIDVGASGVGGPKDIVMYTVTVTYDRIFPLWAFVGQSQKNTFSATTVLKNQPYGDQKDKAPIKIANCI